MNKISKQELEQLEYEMELYFNQLIEVLYTLENELGYNHHNIYTRMINALRKFTKDIIKS